MNKAISDFIAYLKKSSNLGIECPCCQTIIPTKKADLFTEDSLSKKAISVQAQMLEQISDLKEEIKSYKNQKVDRLKTTTRSVNVGKILEKFAPILNGFECESHDCRGVFEPIDYIVFHGLGKRKITHIEFIDVKSGAARLSQGQRMIKEAIERGAVSLKLFKGS